MPGTNGSERRPGSPGAAEDRSVALTRLEPGTCGRVCEMLPVDAEVERLMTMGVCEGRKVMIVRTGDPLILKVLGTRIGVSVRLAARIRVVPCLADEHGC
jgi:Fe2+ transport system protein FeoA